tara:strand:+ start:128 stop:241 length:114 start_codon:yes stop_codon:yes gene_type:complete
MGVQNLYMVNPDLGLPETQKQTKVWQQPHQLQEYSVA